MSRRVKQVLAIVAAWVSFGGCAAFAPRADTSSFYILAALPEVDLAADKTTTGLKTNYSVGIGPIELPGYLDRQQIATRTSTNPNSRPKLSSANPTLMARKVTRSSVASDGSR